LALLSVQFCTFFAFFLQHKNDLHFGVRVREKENIMYTVLFSFSEGLGEAYDGDIAFASSLETFGGGHNDPISVAFGG
jgi:hypothetical protein